jgi:hypothetical protein
MGYVRKTRDEYELQGNYGHGWECLTTEDSYRAAKEQRKCYDENEGGSYRIMPRRVPIEAQQN